MFDLFGNERLIKWKEFREQLETADDPYQSVVDLWIKAPFVSPFLDHQNPGSWPDPWHLVLDDRLDQLAIVLGMLYTLKLTRRFMESEYEIHMSIIDDKNKDFFLVIDGYVLNLEYGSAKPAECFDSLRDSKMVFSGKALP